jgi:hypothetical protein
MGRLRRQAQQPGAEIPDDRGDEQGKDHWEARAGAYLQDQFHRQQGDDAESDGAARKQDAEEIKKPGPQDGEVGRQRVSVDDRRDCIGGIVKTVDEFKTEGNEQCYPQEDVGQPSDGDISRFADIIDQAIRGIKDAYGKHAKK